MSDDKPSQSSDPDLPPRDDKFNTDSVEMPRGRFGDFLGGFVAILELKR